MITTVNKLKIGDRISFIDSDRCNSIMTIIDMDLTCTRDNEWINPWLSPEPVTIFYKMIFLTDGYPNNPWVHRYTLDYRFNKQEDAPIEN
jgi:hypothetical protein